MGTTTLKRQFITDAAGEPIGVILPIEEYQLVEGMLSERANRSDEDARLALVRGAMSDPAFVADLEDTMHAFRFVDAEWPEPGR